MSKKSRLQRVIADYRARLIAQEDQAQSELDAAHAHTLDTIRPMLERLYDQMAEALANDENLSLAWLYEANRLESLKKFLSSQIDQFGMLARTVAGRMQRDGVKLGLDAALEMLKSTLPRGVSWSFGVPSPGAIEKLVGATRAGSPLADLFAGFGREAAKKTEEALINGLSLGWNPRRITPEVQHALGVSRNRALTISRTEGLRSYRSGNLEVYRQNSDIASKWRWTCSLSSRTCAACLAMDGELFDLDQDMDSHVNCRCVPTPLTNSWNDILSPLGIDTSDIEETSFDDGPRGADWLDAQDESTQRAAFGSNAAYELWKNGTPLNDFVGKSHDPDWGTSIYQKSAKQLTKAR
jgi:SPP1 gp7 family putative phage head morphogenesis protein